MAISTYSNVRSADVSPNDIDAYYTYVPNRETTPSTTAIAIDASTIVTPVMNPAHTNEVLGGLFNLKLDASIFNAIGIYNIYLRPKQVRVNIVQCGVLASLPDVKGIVIDTQNFMGLQLPGALANNNALVGYSIEFVQNDTTKLLNTSRIITSSNKCSIVQENISNSTAKAERYRFDNSGSLLFLTVTPSSTTGVKPSDSPFIGVPNQQIIISNTAFDPIVFEISLVQDTIETLSYALYGNQVRSLDGTYTIYDKNNLIYKQYNLFEIKDQFTGEALHDVRQVKTIIDESKDFATITAGVIII